MSEPNVAPSEAPVSARLLRAATLLLSTEGVSAVSARRVAAGAGTSTMALYTHFGGMAHLVGAVVANGLRQFSECMEAVVIADRPPGYPEADPVALLVRLTQAYLAFARAQPQLYGVLLGSTPLGDFHTAVPGGLRERYVLERVIVCMELAIADGRFHPGEPARMAEQWWSMVHGYVLAEAGGGLTLCETVVMWPALLHLFVGLGDSLAVARASLGKAGVVID